MRTPLAAGVLALGLAVIPAGAALAGGPPSPGKTITVYWQMPEPDGGWTAPPTDATATWPQTHLGTSPDGLECGQWAQWDVYRYGKADKAAVDALWADGLLTYNGGPEDAGLHANVPQPWGFVYGGDCAEPDPEPVTHFLETSHTVACGVATITLRNVSPWIYPTSVEIDGVHSYGPTVDNRTDGGFSGPQKDASATRTITFEEDTGVHTVRYRVDAGSEKDLYEGLPVGEWTEFEVESDCIPPQPEPETRTEEGQPTVTCETVTVETVTFEAGFTFDDESGEWVRGEWVETGRTSSQRDATEADWIGAGLDCSGDEEPPVVEPPVVEPPVVEPPAVEPPAVEPPAVVSPEPSPSMVEQNSRETLAETGLNATGIGWIAVALLAGGVFAYAYGTRHRDDEDGEEQ